MSAHDDSFSRPRGGVSRSQAGDGQKRPARRPASSPGSRESRPNPQGPQGPQDPKGSKKKQKKPKNPALRAVLRGFAALVMIGVILGCVAVISLSLYVFDILGSDQYILDLDVKRLEYTTIVYATDPHTGETAELQRLYSPDSNRIWVDYEQMPQVLIDTVVSVEDKRFFEHNGVDWQRTVLSGANYALKKLHLPGLYEGIPGASTLTQQVVRNITQDKENDTARKAREIFRALKLEKRYSKDQILEAYLNTVPFGNETYGIQAAANFYFNKDVSQLTAAECASIIGITKDPTAYNPYVRYENNQKRKSDVLFLMHEQGKLSDAEYEAALAQDITFSTENNKNRIAPKQSYFVDYLMEQVIQDLVTAKGYTYNQAQTELYTGGYRIYATVDTTLQQKLEHIYENWEEYFPKVYNEEYPESAFIVSDLKGRLVAMVGGKGEKAGARVWNRATDTRRQPGSTIKPISSYALAFEQNLIHVSTLVEDKAVSITPDPARPEQVWSPRNYYPGFKGYMTVDEALQRSTNMIPVQLTQMLTPRAMWNFMHDSLKIGLVEADIAYSPMALGSLSYGVTPLEMLGAYQMFGSGGTRTEPYAYTQVLDSTGAVVLENVPTPERVISYETASVMNKALQKVTTGFAGTGTQARLASGIPVAGKTGTTDDDVDQWFIGLSPYYVAVCWMGYDEQFQVNEDPNTGQKVPVLDAYGQKIPNSIRYAGLGYPPPKLWKTVMDQLHEGLEYKDFTYSSNVVQIQYCALTGYQATPECPTKVSGWYKPENIPSSCPYHGDRYIDYSVPLVGSTSQSLLEDQEEDDEDDDRYWIPFRRDEDDD